MDLRQERRTQFGHRLPTGNGESAALNCAAHSANYSISCGHPMAEPGTYLSWVRDVTIQGCDESEWVGVEDWSALSWFFFNCLYYLLFIALYTSTVGQQEEDHRRGEEGRGRASAQVGRRGGGGRPRGQAALDLHLNFPPKSGIRD